MPAIDLLTHPMFSILTQSLLHFLWQGTAVLLILLAVLRLSAPRPSVRYRVLLCGLFVMAACPPVTFVVLCRSPGYLNAQARLHESALQFSQDSAMLATSFPAPSGTSPSILFEDATTATVSDTATPAVWQRWQRSLQPALLTCWLVGVALLTLRLAAGWYGARRWLSRTMPVTDDLTQQVRSMAERLSVRRSVRTFASPRVRQAMVVGLLRPAILIPTAWLANLPPDVLESVLLHELAHVRRHDLWVNLLQRLAETLLFYHPAVWWVSHQVRVEREKCCDEMAVSILGDRLTYARSLEHVAREFVMPRPAVLALSFGDKKMELLSRVRSVLGTEPARTATGFPVLILLFSLAACCIGFLPRVLAEDEKDAAGVGTEARTQTAPVEDKHDVVHPPTQIANSTKSSNDPPPNKATYEVETTLTQGDVDAAIEELRAENRRLRQLVRSLHPHPSTWETEEALKRPVAVSFQDVPLKQALAELTDGSGLNVTIDEDGLEHVGIRENEPTTLTVDGIMLGSALNLLLQPLQLSYRVAGDGIQVARPETLVIRNYPVGDLVSAVPDGSTDPVDINEDEPFLNRVVPAPQSGATRELKELAKLITSTVEPESWDELGGSGTARPYKATLSLVIRQTQEVHEQLEDLLEQLRRMRVEQAAAREVPLSSEHAKSAMSSLRDSAAWSEESKRILSSLERRVSLAAENEPLSEIMRQVRTQADVNIVLDTLGLSEASVTTDQPVTIRANALPLRELLERVLTPLGLRYQIKDEVLKITSRLRAGGEWTTCNYQVSDLIARKYSGRRGFETSLESLASVLTQVVDPESWEQRGGPAKIVPFEGTMSLVVCQQRKQHRQLEEFLAAIRDDDRSRLELIAGRQAIHVCLLGEDSQTDRLREDQIQTKPGRVLSTEALKDDAKKLSSGEADVRTRMFNTPSGVIVIYEMHRSQSPVIEKLIKP